MKFKFSVSVAVATDYLWKRKTKQNGKVMWIVFAVSSLEGQQAVSEHLLLLVWGPALSLVIWSFFFFLVSALWVMRISVKHRFAWLSWSPLDCNSSGRKNYLVQCESTAALRALLNLNWRAPVLILSTARWGGDFSRDKRWRSEGGWRSGWGIFPVPPWSAVPSSLCLAVIMRPWKAACHSSASDTASVYRQMIEQRGSQRSQL